MTMTILCTPQGNDASGLQAIVVYVQVACIPAFDVTVAIETLLPWALGVGTVPRVPRVPRLPRGLWACWMILHERKGYLLQYPLGFAIMLGDGEPTPHIAWGIFTIAETACKSSFPKEGLAFDTWSDSEAVNFWDAPPPLFREVVKPQTILNQHSLWVGQSYQ